ncbi:MAG: YjjG family noncanonical pyrimidine nucleotidase [Nitriliruptorales bacterium]|nr:YjjG family noncanonical pyrimidine nucleotidase [Nitriliruptorales bacterium]
MYDWLLFDLDGTLLDYDAAEAAALKAALEEVHVDMTPELAAVYRKVNKALWRAFERDEVTAGHIRTQRFHHLVEELTLDADPEVVAGHYIHHLAGSTHVIEGAREVVEALRADHSIAIITNGLSDVQRPRLESTGFVDLADVIVISDEEGVSKPDSRFFEVTFERMGRPDPDDALVIGDSLTSDMAGGARYGVDTCWVNPEGHENDLGVEVTYEIAHVREVPGLIGSSGT